MDSIRGSVCRSCRQRLTAQSSLRSFSTSTSRGIVPPESPYYIDVPTSYQPYLPYKHPVKGTLPKPRELFPAKRPDKPSPEYLENVTREPLPKNVLPPEQLSEVAKQKARMAATRRSQLREGLKSLHARKQAELKTMAATSRAKQLQRNALLAQAEREDARLTAVSVPKEMQPSHKSSVEALEAEVATAKRIHETKLANIERVTAEKQARKMDALHTLYMNARTFITKEEDYKKLIDDQFEPRAGPGQKPRHADFMNHFSNAGLSMWNFGQPTSVSAMINNVSGRQEKKNVPDAVTRFGRTAEVQKSQVAQQQERFKKIAEKLSGGKI